MDELIFNGKTTDEIIRMLTTKTIDIPLWSKILKDYEPDYHRINFDTVGRKDKIRSNGEIDKAARISIGMEKLLTKRMTEFMFTIPVKRIYHNIDNNKIRQAIAKAMEAIYKYARIDSENKKRGVAYFASCEIFTLWYTVKRNNKLYGFDAKHKLKCKTFSPMDGVELYPLFDQYDDMVAMSVKCSRLDGTKKITYFETYTANRRLKWIDDGSGWDNIVDEDISILGKIPGVYIPRQQPIFHGLSPIREEIEYTLSRNSDVIAYNSAPVLKIIGKLMGGQKEDKGETQRVFRIENGGDMGYVAWSQAIEALRYHVSTLTGMFWAQGQMPDISFEQMKSLGNIGYDARQTLLTDAHLKVGDESGAWIEAFERENNVIKAFLVNMKPEWKEEIENVEVEHVITPFIQNDEMSEIKKWTTANGGKPIVSHLESIQNAGISSDPVKSLDAINEEEAKAAVAQSVMDSYM